MNKQEILLTDMKQCHPAEALSPRARRGYWQLVSYRTDEVSGTMILSRTETGAPEITLPLKAEGWFAIHLAFPGENWAGKPLLKVKLSGDPCFVPVETETGHHYLEEGFWKIADLSGQELVIAQQRIGDPRPAGLAYVRLVALTEEEVTRYKDRSGSKRLIAMNDAFSLYFFKGEEYSAPDLQEAIESAIELYRDTDFGKICWETWEGDRVNYPAKVGVLWGQGIEDFPRPGDRRIAECMQKMRAQGLDSLRVALEYAHKTGLELYADMRMGFFGMCPPAECFEGPFFREHPEFRCRDYDGTEVSHLSYAFPEVRRYVLSLWADTAQYDIDGVNLIYHRGHPYVLYEEPLVKGFMKKEMDIDPCTLAEHDRVWYWYDRVVSTIPYDWMGRKWLVDTLPEQRWGTRLDEFTKPVQRWLRYRSRPMTEFLRDLRRVLDTSGKGRKRKICVSIFGSEVDNLFYGLDVEAWVKEGLVDILIPLAWPEYLNVDVSFFSRITEDSGCQVYPNVMPRQMEPKEYLKKAMNYYEQGADGLAFWDTDGRNLLLNQWQVIRELGHKEELRKWLETEYFSRKFLLLRRLGDYTVDRYHPESGG